MSGDCAFDQLVSLVDASKLLKRLNSELQVVDHLANIGLGIEAALTQTSVRFLIVAVTEELFYGFAIHKLSSPTEIG